MRTINERALFDRAKRAEAKNGMHLAKHKKGTRDMLMNGELYAYLSDEKNVVINYWDVSGFVDMCREIGYLKEDEEI